MVVSLTKEMLDTLQLAEGSAVSIELDAVRGQIIITPLLEEAAGVDAAFARQVAEFIEEYRPALEALAK
jgi:antitoxin component of MazEF toxin-antitoxin module